MYNSRCNGHNGFYGYDRESIDIHIHDPFIDFDFSEHDNSRGRRGCECYDGFYNGYYDDYYYDYYPPYYAGYRRNRNGCYR